VTLLQQKRKIPTMILVTGGAGFIGSNITAALAERGTAVAICDRFRTANKWRNLSKLELREVVAPEVLAQWLDTHATRVEAVVHMGAISSTTESDVDLIIEANFRLSQLLWRWCASRGKPLVYASSAATYGAGEYGFDDDASLEALAKLLPLNAYGWSKHLFDRWVARELAEGGARPPQWVGLKFFNVYGPNEYHKGGMQSVVAQKYPLAAAGEALTLFRSHRPDVADGGQKRDFVYVRDCVDVVLWLLEHPSVNGLYNLGTGEAHTFEELAHALFAALHRPADVKYVDMPTAIRPNYQYFTEAKMDRLRKAGYSRPFTSIGDGVREYVERYLSQSDRYR
jgi:ADP-L-glycero-D-manno-heptose 6-epimerase